ncbi:MAG: potassium channel protein [Actinobacteria bacterium]|nr:potassium channel protein [Actinomycetota bacterium]
MGAQRRVVIALFMFLALLILAPFGYMLIEGMGYNDAFYMTVITVFTVGFTEVEPLTTAGQYFTIIVIIIGVSALFFLIASFLRYTFREAFRETFGRRRMDLRIKKLQDHYVICGYGRVGEVVCDTMAEAGVDFVVVEIDHDRIEDAIDRGFLHIEGSATETDTLEQAGVKRAKGLVCALENDADNLFTTISARFLNPDLMIVTRSISRDSVDKLRFAGADRIISPYELSGRQMATFLLRPGVYDYLDLVTIDIAVEYRMEELLVEEGSPLDGHTIGELDIKAKTGALITAVRKSGSMDFETNPHKDTRIDAGDLLIALGTERDLTGLEKLAVA